MLSTRYSCQILAKLEISQQIFERYSSIQCPVRDELFYAEPQTDRQEDITKLIVFFCNLKKTPEKYRKGPNPQQYTRNRL